MLTAVFVITICAFTVAVACLVCVVMVLAGLHRMVRIERDLVCAAEDLAAAVAGRPG